MTDSEIRVDLVSIKHITWGTAETISMFARCLGSEPVLVTDTRPVALFLWDIIMVGPYLQGKRSRQLFSPKQNDNLEFDLDSPAGARNGAQVLGLAEDSCFAVFRVGYVVQAPDPAGGKGSCSVATPTDGHPEVGLGLDMGYAIAAG